MLSTGTLIHGGVMVNYRCGAACRHCLYSCSPTRRNGYVDEETARKICALLVKGGCRSVHIGGGEPFLDFEGLLMMIRKLRKARVTVEYIETNAFWAAEPCGSGIKRARETIERLLKEGADTLCISVDPFHAEYVPWGAPLALAELCDRSGMGYFLWKREFLPALSRLDSSKPHSRPDMEKVISRDYIRNTASLYGIGYGGRAVNIEREYGALYPAESFTESSASNSALNSASGSPCRHLLSSGHFHVDKDCCFIPPRCTGIRIPLQEAVEGIPPRKYPAFEALYSGGVRALFELARQEGFTPDEEGYPSACNLCFHIRRFLAGPADGKPRKQVPELDPDHYEEALKYY